MLFRCPVGTRMIFTRVAFGESRGVGVGHANGLKRYRKEAVSPRWSERGGTSKRLFLTLVMALLLIAQTWLAPQADAAFPGSNGLLVVGVCVDVVCDDEPTMGFEPVRDIDLFTVRPGTAALQRITSGPHADIHPSWSPDGSEIVFTRALPNQAAADIYVMNRDGSGVRQLTDTPAMDEIAPSWSPDGSKIVFAGAINHPIVLNRYTEDYDLYTMNADGSDVRSLLIAPGVQRHPAWSPDGAWIAFAHSPPARIGLVSADGSRTRWLTRPGMGGFVFSPEWSPDGEWIAFSVLTVEPDYDIWRIRPDRSGLSNLTANNPGIDVNPAWAPDGKSIAFLRSQPGSQITKLYMMNPQGGKVRKVIDLELEAQYRPSWGARQ